MRLRGELVAVALLVLGTALALWLQEDVGVARDETIYMRTGSRYADWWADKVEGKGPDIAKTWGKEPGGDGNAEHPPLMKTLFGVSKKIFHDKLGVASQQTAYRAPSAVLCGVLVAIVFLFVGSVWGRAEGLVAALLTLLLPRGLFHAGLACFDAPIATLWIATLFAYWRALASWRWAIVAGVLFGLALATKHNAIILPFVVLAHYTWISIAQRSKTGPRWREIPLALWRRAPLAPTAMLLIGPLVLYGLWPWLWHAPIANATAWMKFHFHHTHYNFEYLGRNWNAPTFPWHVALVTTLLTVPVATLAAGGLGGGVLVARAWRRKAADAARAPGLLLFLSLGAAMGPFFLGSTPIFGAEKHWSPAIPSICIAAGIGVVWAARRAAAVLAERWQHRLVVPGAIALVAALVVGASASEVAASHPYALTHYNALAGGAPGGADVGMNRQFWGNSARGVLPWLGTRPPGRVYSHDASMAWGMYIHWGHLPRGFPDAGHEEQGIANSKYAIVIHELHFNRHDYLIWASYGTVRPAYVLTADGVPVVSVYERPAP